jgi:hypothetical protein
VQWPDNARGYDLMVLRLLLLLIVDVGAADAEPDCCS